MRRWTLLLAGAALWLFLAAIPALADGGPHVAANNNGTGPSGLTADSCAGCHRAHTAQSGPVGGRGTLLAVSSTQALCLSCHGTNGLGASTNVEDGVQYASLNNGTYGGDTGPIIGALRSGGFVNARINSSNPFRSATEQVKVSVLGTGQPVTSAHLNTTDNGLKLPTVAWGNGALNSGAGPTVTMDCVICHNVHGNGQYRILEPIPAPAAATGNTFTPVATPGVTVSDYLVGGVVPATTRNYTVIQTDAAGTRIYLASDVIAGETANTWTNTAGDYWHRRVPWNASGNDAPNGLTASTGFSLQITTWCSACHTRYINLGESGGTDTTDAIYRYQHATTGSRACTTCHVAHGSNAKMPGSQGTNYSTNFPYPDNVYANGVGSDVSASSRLLKIDNRGTCQMCHDPATDFVGVPDIGGPTPAVP